MNNRNRRNVMMISSVHVWFDTRIFFKEAISLANHSFNVDFYAIEAEKNNVADVINNPNLKVNLLKRKSRFKRWLYWFEFYRKFMTSSAYFLHIQDSELLYVAKAIKRKLKDDVFIIYDMHEHLPAAVKTKTWIPAFMRSFMSKFVSNKEKKLMKYCDEVFFAELSYKDNYQDIELNSLDILNYPKYEPTEFVVSKSPEDEVFTLVYVGALIRQRGLYEMIDLMDELINHRKVNVQLNLVGQINEKYDDVINYISNKKLDKVIHLLGRKPYSQIWSIYNSSDLGLCLLQPTPNNLNSQSTKIFEYMAAGLPFIASNFPDFHNICQEYDCGIDALPTDSSSMADYVMKLMNDETRRVQMGVNGINTFKKHFDWKVEEKKMIKLYEEKVNQHD